MKVNIGDYPKKTSDRKIKVEISDHDVYSLDYTLALVILPALVKYRDVACEKVTWGCFCMDHEEYQTLSAREKKKADKQATKKMKDTLDTMIHAFQLIVNDCATLDKKIDAQIQEGLDLFAKYYRGLWW